MTIKNKYFERKRNNNLNFKKSLESQLCIEIITFPSQSLRLVRLKIEVSPFSATYNFES